MAYIIGSFNVHDFSEFSKRNDGLMAEIVRNEKFDLIALQEILAEGAAKRLLRALGPGWEGWQMCPLSFSAKKAKGYAFLWNSRRLGIARDGKPSGEPFIYSQYSMHPASQLPRLTRLTRDPLVGRFQPVCGPFVEIRIINAHIYAEGHKTHRLPDEDGECVKQAPKQHEYMTLAGEIYARVAAQRLGNFRPAYTVLTGDYNMLPNWFEECDSDPWFTEKCEGRRMTTVVSELTTLRQPKQADLDKKGYRFSVDHFTYDAKAFEGVSVVPSRVDAPAKYCGGNFREYRETVSDHVPIRLEIGL